MSPNENKQANAGAESPAPVTPPVRGRYALLTLKQAKRVIVGVIGATVILFGMVMLFIPGPGVVTMIAGLAILATEFLWAKKWLDHIKKQGVAAANHLRNRKDQSEFVDGDVPMVKSVLPDDPCVDDPLVCPPEMPDGAPRKNSLPAAAHQPTGSGRGC